MIYQSIKLSESSDGKAFNVLNITYHPILICVQQRNIFRRISIKKFQSAEANLGHFFESAE